MNKRFRKTAAILSATGLVSFATFSSMAFAIDENFNHGDVYGVGLTANLDMSNIKIVGFAHNPVDIDGSTTSTSSMFAIDKGLMKTELPLVTFGKDVEYPGVFYSNNEVQFQDLVLGAAEGDKTSIAKITMYSAAAIGVGAAIGCIVLDASAGGGGSSYSEPDSNPDGNDDGFGEDIPTGDF